MRSRDTSGPPDEATAREVAIRTGIGLVLVPSVARVSDHLTVTYRLADPETGRTLKLRQAEASLSGAAAEGRRPSDRAAGGRRGRSRAADPAA